MLPYPYHCAVCDGRTTDVTRGPAAWVREHPAAVLAAGAVLLGAVAVALLRWRLWGAHVPAAAPARMSDWFDPAAVAHNRGFRRGLWLMAAIGAALTPLAAIAVACLGRWWRPVVVRMARARPWRAGLLLGGALAVAATLATLPLSAARFAWGRGHGVITQPTGAWLLDVLRGLGVQLVIMGLLGTLVAVLVWRLPRAWWAALGIAVAVLAFVMSTLTPVLIEPLFQRTEPLRDATLRAQVLDLAHRAGVQADDVRVNDASARTTAANAYVSGLGDSRRIVLYDTLVRDFPDDQIRMVVAHELTHVQRRHILKGTVWVAALALPVCLLLFAVVGWRTGFALPGRGRDGCDLVLRRVAVLAAGAAVIGALALPLENAVSRSYEREADAGAMALTGDDVAAAVGLQQGLVRLSRGVPDTPAAVNFWFGSHPTPLERIGLALRIGEGG